VTNRLSFELVNKQSGLLLSPGVKKSIFCLVLCHNCPGFIYICSNCFNALWKKF